MRHVALAVLALVACGSGQGAPPSAASPATPAPTAKAVVAKTAVAQPADFAPQALTVCPAPETGDLGGYAAAYRTGIPAHDAYAGFAAVVSRAGAESAVASLAAPDAGPEVCRGALGFAYKGRQVGKEPAVVSIVAVFKDAAAAQAASPEIKAALKISPPSYVDASAFGPDAKIQDNGEFQLLFWRRDAVISVLLTQEVDNWSAGAHAIDRRLGGS